LAVKIEPAAAAIHLVWLPRFTMAAAHFSPTVFVSSQAKVQVKQSI
jgi:hypothetical protein